MNKKSRRSKPASQAVDKAVRQVVLREQQGRQIQEILTPEGGDDARNALESLKPYRRRFGNNILDTASPDRLVSGHGKRELTENAT